VSQELIRMAILWHEMWHEALEEASRQYFGENNVQAMMDTLFPLHRMMEAGPPTTLKEIAFVQVRAMFSFLQTPLSTLLCVSNFDCM
jgi:FKBP12-rapamycin complex-associated protein